MTPEDYKTLADEERVRNEMLKHVTALRELSLQIPNSDGLRGAIKTLQYLIAYWGL